MGQEGNERSGEIVQKRKRGLVILHEDVGDVVRWGESADVEPGDEGYVVIVGGEWERKQGESEHVALSA
jgi:hypothetical protein